MNASSTVGSCMTRPLVSVGPDTDIQTAIRLLISEQISGVPVVDAMGAPLGFLSEKDCFRLAFRCCYYRYPGGRVSDYMTSPAVSVDASADILAVAEMFMNGPYRRFPVVSDGRVVGVISRREALEALLKLW